MKTPASAVVVGTRIDSVEATKLLERDANQRNRRIEWICRCGAQFTATAATVRSWAKHSTAACRRCHHASRVETIAAATPARRVTAVDSVIAAVGQAFGLPVTGATLAERARVVALDLPPSAMQPFVSLLEQVAAAPTRPGPTKGAK